MKAMKTIKKHLIHILAITAIEPDLFEQPYSQNAVIVCTERENRFISSGILTHVLILPFSDVEEEAAHGAFTKAHARVIIRFVESLPDEVSDIYVCCSKGSSRSAAVAAALLRMSGRSDKDVWLNPYYVPNTLVYYRLCREYGLFVTKRSVRRLKKRNEQAFRNAQSGKPCKYERWQIIS